MSRLTLGVVLLLLSVTLSAFGRRGDVRSPKDFVLANNHLGFKLLNQLSRENEPNAKRENIFFSPYSIAVALAMVHQGAGGSTAKELESVLGYALAKLDKADKAVMAQKVHESNENIFAPEVESNKSLYTLKSGNAMMVNQNFPLLDSFRQTLVEKFRAELFQVDFDKDPTAAMNMINNWVANRTNDKIKTLLSEPPSPATQLSLLNAVYFKGTWKYEFDPNRTKPGTFTGHAGAKYENVSFMNIKDDFNVAQLEELNAAMIELPYRGDQLSMYAILPNDKSGDLSAIKQALSPWYLESAIGRAYSHEIKLKFPKMDFKTDYDLVDTLKALGITEVFDGNKSNLTGLTASGAKLVVDKVKHKATIEVNEKGSEATGVTEVRAILASARYPPEDLKYEFDHPFVFLIRHNKNGQILFLGEVNKV